MWIGSEATGYAKTREFEEAEPSFDLATALQGPPRRPIWGPHPYDR